MKRADWSSLAKEDLEEILYYVRVTDGRPAMARQLAEEFRQVVDEHAEKQIPGHRHDAAPPGWLYLRHKRWLIFYRPQAFGIQVLRVIDAARDLPAQFE